VARFLGGIPGAAGRAVAGLWGRMKGAFQTALDGVQRFAEKIAAAVARIAGLKAKASGNPGGGSSSRAVSHNWTPALRPQSHGETWPAPIVDVSFRPTR
jgi:hypothetical protein